MKIKLLNRLIVIEFETLEVSTKVILVSYGMSQFPNNPTAM